MVKLTPGRYRVPKFDQTKKTGSLFFVFSFIRRVERTKLDEENL